MNPLLQKFALPAAAAMLAFSAPVPADAPFGKNLPQQTLNRLMGIHSLGASFELGRGRQTDFVRAAETFREAALLGFPLSQYRLGHLYEYGLGVAQDFTRAYIWYALAARYGDARAVESRDEMAARLDNVQIVKAQEMLRILESEIL